MDLSPGTLEFLVHLMCAQARECLFEKGELALFGTFEENKEKPQVNIDDCLVLGQEAAHVSDQFGRTVFFLSNCANFYSLINKFQNVHIYSQKKFQLYS
jgi:hypothetical protein